VTTKYPKGGTLSVNIRKGLKCAVIAAVAMTGAAGQSHAATELSIAGTGDLAPNRGSAVIPISVQCDQASDEGVSKTASLTVHLFQSHGRLINIGVSRADETAVPQCDGNSAIMDVEVFAIPGLKFQPGPATVLIKLTEQTSVPGTTPEGPATVTGTTTTESGDKVNLRP
jgi:hypothetical protein